MTWGATADAVAPFFFRSGALTSSPEGMGSVTKADSLVRGAHNPTLLEHTIGEALDLAVRRWPDVEAVVSVHQGVRWTWAEFGRRVDAFAAGLLALGLEPGDRVGVWGPNSAEWTLAQFATARAGLIQVNINPAYRLSELEYTLVKVGVKCLIAAEKFKTSDYVGMVEAVAPEIVASAPGKLTSSRLPELKTVIQIGGETRPGWLDFDAVPDLASSADAVRLVAVAADLDRQDPINIQFTSGTTGLPKGATLSHHNIVNNGYFVASHMAFTHEDSLCIPVPLYHCFGMVMGVLGCVTHGAAMIFPSEAFEPGAVLEAVAAEKCTALYGVPTMFIAELDHPQFRNYDLSSLRTG